MLNKKYIFIILIVAFLVIPSTIIYLKNEKIETFKTNNYIQRIEQSELTLKTLIKEKQNTTATIAIGLVNNENIVRSLQNKEHQAIDLNKYSQELRETTEFKNVWFQLIDKEGISIQRSWSDYTGDNIASVRKDLQVLLKAPKAINSISVGRFDMTFKSITPVYDYQNIFIGFVEVITHFNSISKKLKDKNIDSIILADKKYYNQITKPFTKKFMEEYYVANVDADVSLIKYLESIDIDGLIQNILDEKYFIDKSLNSLISYYQLKDIDKNTMGHFFMFHPLDDTDTSKVMEIEYFYNILLLISILVSLSLFYFNFKIKEYSYELINKKIFIIVLVLFLVVFSVMYKIIEAKYNSDIEFYKKNLQEQTTLEYRSILNNNKTLAELIFLKEIDTRYIKNLMRHKSREVLYEHLKESYEELQKKYNVRQIHFHLTDSTSFLRMHRPLKYGDSLSGIRDSVDYVNRVKKPYHGFEEGRIYNGFRYVFPLFDNKEHIGSVEVSFDIYAFIDNYIESFNIQRINFLINKAIVDQKVFDSEKSNYTQSPVKGFYFDKQIVEKLNNLDKPIIPHKKDSTKLEQLTKQILQGNIFVTHFDEVNELTIIIPLLNKISGKVVGSLHVSKSDSFIQKRQTEFHELIATVFITLVFMMIFVYREIISKVKVNNELKNKQLILDSQKSFIVITDGKNIKASNNSMLEFFGFKDLVEFKSKHDCICEYFEEEQGYIKQQMGELNWFEYVIQNLSKDNLVQMKDKDGNRHIYYIELNIENKINNEDYIISFIDITNIKNMEQHLIQNEKMASLGTMIGNIAHQWRQPLSIITTSASGVQLKKEFASLSDEELNKSMETIVSTAEFLSETIDTFRDYIKEEKVLKEYNIQDVLDRTLKIIQPALSNNYIKLINKIDYDQVMSKMISSGELSQVITNIINNAKDILIEKKIKEPEITIESYKQSDNIVISIEDNAGGIPSDIINQIFEPYFTTKHQSVGTGLGLYMSHKIIHESFGGQLYVENTKKGAKFYVKI